MKDLSVRQATVADWPAIQEFVEQSYGTQSRYKGWVRHQWQFLNNPHRNTPGFPIWIAETRDGRVVGAIGVQPGTLQLAENIYPAGWIVDVMIAPDFRGQGLGHHLHRALAAENPILVTLTMALATRKIAEKAGAVTLGEGAQYTRLGSPSAGDIRTYLVERSRRRRWASTLVTAGCWLGVPYLLSPIARLVGRQDGPAPDPSISIREVEQFGEVAESLWQKARTGYPAIFCRDGKHMDWRFGAVPDLSYRRYIAFRGETPAGLLVLRLSLDVELPIGFISEIFACRGDLGAWRSLLHHAINVLRPERALIEGAASCGELQQIFGEYGFIPTHRVRPTVVASDPVVRREVEKNKDDWFFTKGDHDWDQVHPLGHT